MAADPAAAVRAAAEQMIERAKVLAALAVEAAGQGRREEAREAAKQADRLLGDVERLPGGKKLVREPRAHLQRAMDLLARGGAPREALMHALHAVSHALQGAIAKKRQQDAAAISR